MSDRVLTITDNNFAGHIEENEGLAIVDFWATWCGPCRIVAPIVEQLAAEYHDLTVGKVDVDANPNTSARFGIRSIPSILFFKDGRPVDMVVGAVPKAHLQEKIEALL